LVITKGVIDEVIGILDETLTEIEYKS